MNEELPGFLQEYLDSLSIEELKSLRDKLKAGAPLSIMGDDIRSKAYPETSQAEQATQATIQAKLRQAMLAELDQNKGSFEAQSLTRLKYKKLGYDDQAGDAPEVEWLRREEERKAAKDAEAADISKRNAQAYGRPQAQEQDADTESLMQAYKSRLSKIRRGDVNSIVALQLEFRKKGLDV